MLIISRRNGESIRVGDGTVITIVKTGAEVVRVGIDAPKDVKILRDELGEEDGRHIQSDMSVAGKRMGRQ